MILANFPTFTLTNSKPRASGDDPLYSATPLGP